jgi:hypothetical protein
MSPSDREWLLGHLRDQATILARAVDAAAQDPESTERLIAVRDQVFCMKETLGTLGVPHALVSRDEWSRGLDSDQGGT